MDGIRTVAFQTAVVEQPRSAIKPGFILMSRIKLIPYYSIHFAVAVRLVLLLSSLIDKSFL